VATTSGVVQIWDTIAGQLTCTLKGSRDQLFCVAWSPTGTRLAAGGQERTIQIWDLPTGKVVLTLTGHTGDVSQVSWSPDGKRLASNSVGDRTVKIWDPLTGQNIMSLTFQSKGPNTPLPNTPLSVAWSPDGSRLAVGCASGVTEILDAADGYRLAGRPGAGKQE
jgi:WD40 repeat protein